MKKGLLIFLLFIVFSCNNKKKGSIQNNAPRVIETIGTHISPDSLKPAPIIYLSEKAGPEVIAIPTKTGSMRIRHDKGVDEKIQLLPIITSRKHPYEIKPIKILFPSVILRIDPT